MSFIEGFIEDFPYGKDCWYVQGDIACRVAFLNKDVAADRARTLKEVHGKEFPLVRYLSEKRVRGAIEKAKSARGNFPQIHPEFDTSVKILQSLIDLEKELEL